MSCTNQCIFIEVYVWHSSLEDNGGAYVWHPETGTWIAVAPRVRDGMCLEVFLYTNSSSILKRTNIHS